MNLNKLDSFIDEHYQRTNISGYLRITLKDKIIYEKGIGYADRESEAEFTKDTRFTLYSLSKPFCAIGIMTLYDKGLIALEAHPSKYLPEAEGFDKRVTLHSILNHTSGLPDFEQIPLFAEKHKSGTYTELREQMKELTAFPQYFEPGKKGMYANINFIIPALIIENVTGECYYDYMAREVFAPLGVKSAMFHKENAVIPNLATGYCKDANEEIIPVSSNINWLFGAGDIATTADDVYRLNIAVKNRPLLKASTWERVLTPSEINCFGYGCSIINWHGHRRIQHNGGHTGFRTLHIQLINDDFDIIYLSNSGWGEARAEYSEKIYELFYCDSIGEKCDFEMDKGYI